MVRSSFSRSATTAIPLRRTPGGGPRLDGLGGGSVVDGTVLELDGERPVEAFGDALGVDETACTPRGARHERLAVGVEYEDSVRPWAWFLVIGLALTRSRLFRVRPLVGGLGLAACDRSYRARARGHGGCLSGDIIRRAMQGPGLALGCHPRYSGVRFLDRCHCYCSLTLVQSAGRAPV